MTVPDYIPCMHHSGADDDIHKYSTAAIVLTTTQGSIVIGANDDGELVTHLLDEPVDCVNFGWYAVEQLVRLIPGASAAEFNPTTGIYNEVLRDLQDENSHP